MFGNDLTQDDINRLHNANVVDENGDKVGSIGQIYLDDQTSRPTWVTVKTGLFGTKETFIPLDRASESNGDIRVPYTKDFIKDAPNLDADKHISEQEEDELYRYYNVTGGAADTTRRDDAAVAGTAGTAGAAGVAGDVDRDRDLDRDREGAVDRDRDRSAGDSMVRREEELRVGTERVETGRVRLRKHVVTERETVNVPVEREEVHVTREPVRDGEVGGRIGGDDEVSVTLHEDRPVVSKETVDKERVGLDTETHRDTEAVSAELQKERVEVERDGDVGRDDKRRDDRV